MAVYRLRQLWPEYGGRVRVAWRALSLEVKNGQSTPKFILDQEIPLMARQEPDLPISLWRAPEWQYPVTLLPAFEALACAARQGDERAWEYSWRVRSAFFAESRCVSMRHELRKVARECGLDLARFQDDWDSGAQRRPVLAESHTGWEVVKVPGSPTFVLPSGRQIHNPAALKATWSEEKQIVKVDPPPDAPDGDWRRVYRALLDAAASGQS
jgi:predicted DsbA family dithiol-disulfide isomerase